MRCLGKSCLRSDSRLPSVLMMGAQGWVFPQRANRWGGVAGVPMACSCSAWLLELPAQRSDDELWQVSRLCPTLSAATATASVPSERWKRAEATIQATASTSVFHLISMPCSYAHADIIISAVTLPGPCLKGRQLWSWGGSCTFLMRLKLGLVLIIL